MTHEQSNADLVRAMSAQADVIQTLIVRITAAEAAIAVLELKTTGAAQVLSMRIDAFSVQRQ